MEYLAYKLLVYVPIAKEDLHSFTLHLLFQTIHSENKIESDEDFGCLECILF